MSKEDEFYIGWQEAMPASNRSFLRKRLIPLFLGIPIIVVVLIFSQKPFNNHTFELGKLSTVSGIYYHTPFPMLIADAAGLPEGESNEILLLGFGKFGATGTMKAIQEKQGNLHGKKITLKGTLIYGAGKTLMELTQQEDAFVSIDSPVAVPAPTPPPLQAIQVKGEILDPKCYFGVMKPGEGKIHKSCAIRCISGGIPPVFREETGSAKNPYEYYLILDEKGGTVNQAVLPFVGERIVLDGKMTQFSSWKMLYVDIAAIDYISEASN